MEICATNASALDGSRLTWSTQNIKRFDVSCHQHCQSRNDVSIQSKGTRDGNGINTDTDTGHGHRDGTTKTHKNRTRKEEESLGLTEMKIEIDEMSLSMSL